MSVDGEQNLGKKGLSREQVRHFSLYDNTPPMAKVVIEMMSGKSRTDNGEKPSEALIPEPLSCRIYTDPVRGLVFRRRFDDETLFT